MMQSLILWAVTFTENFQNFEERRSKCLLEQPDSELMNQHGVKAIFQFTQPDTEDLIKVARWVDQNNISINVEKEFSLDQAADALDYQKSVHPKGKVVLAM